MTSYQESPWLLRRSHPRRALRRLSRATTVVLNRLEHAAHAGLAKIVGDTPVRGRRFPAFAISTAAAELRHRWPHLQAPRGLHQQHVRERLPGAVEKLSSDLRRSPRPTELAALLEEDLDDVIEALADDQAYCGGRR